MVRGFAMPHDLRLVEKTAAIRAEVLFPMAFPDVRADCARYFTSEYASGEMSQSLREAAAPILREFAVDALIPSPAERDSFRGFLNRHFSDSTWQTDGGLPWVLRFLFETISMRLRSDCLRFGRGTPIRAVDCWRWAQSTTAAHGAMRRELAV